MPVLGTRSPTPALDDLKGKIGGSRSSQMVVPQIGKLFTPNTPPAFLTGGSPLNPFNHPACNKMNGGFAGNALPMQRIGGSRESYKVTPFRTNNVIEPHKINWLVETP